MNTCSAAGCAPRGRNGGQDGAAGRVSLTDGNAMRSKGQQHVPSGTHLVLEMAGGGGFGDPAMRDFEQVVEDVRNELITPEVAYEDYKVALNDDGSVNERVTQSLRGVS